MSAVLTVAIAALLSAAALLPAQEAAGAETLALWPEGHMPGHGSDKPEQSVMDGTVLHVSEVSKPMLTISRVAAATKPVPALIVCPGGGYGRLAYDKEGTDIA